VIVNAATAGTADEALAEIRKFLEAHDA